MVGNAATVRIASEVLQAGFRPDLGGRMTSLVAGGGTDVVVPMPEGSYDPLFWPKGGAYPLIPYHNRISDGLLETGGGKVALRPHPDALPHTLHGPSHLHAWTLTSQEADRLVMQLRCKADRDWPWAYEASQTARLDGNVFTLELTVRNLDSSPMPAGLGWHPYIASQHPVGHDACFHWPHREDYLGQAQRVAIDGRPNSDFLPTAYLQTWKQARMRIGETATVILTASDVFDHLVVHKAGAYVCVEPVSHAANGFNLAQRGTSETGTCLLAPGATLSGKIQLQVTGA